MNKKKNKTNPQEGIVLSSGQLATEYVQSLPEQHREVASESILECLKKDWDLTNLNITRTGRALNRKRLGIK